MRELRELRENHIIFKLTATPARQPTFPKSAAAAHRGYGGFPAPHFITAKMPHFYFWHFLSSFKKYAVDRSYRTFINKLPPGKSRHRDRTMNNVNVINNEQPNTSLMTINDRIAALKQKAEQSIELWDASAGSVLCGELTGKREVVSQYGPQTQLIVRCEDDSLMAYWLTPYIQKQMQAQNANFGDLLCITADGKRTTANNKQYNAFTVLIEKS